MKRVLSFTVTTKSGAKPLEIADAAEWQIMDKFFFIRSRSAFLPKDGDRVSNDKFWIPLDDIEKMTCTEEMFFENKKEKIEFCKGEQIKE